MAVPVSIVGQVFNAAEISIGAVVGTGPFTFTENASLATALIGGIAAGLGSRDEVSPSAAS